MPIHQRFDDELRTFFVTLEGDVGEEELLEFARKMAAAPPSGRRELIDLRDAGSADFPTEVLRKVAEAFAAQDETSGDTSVAIVASRDWAFGLSRMYQAFRDESKVRLRVFRDMAEARRWLELPEEE